MLRRRHTYIRPSFKNFYDSLPSIFGWWPVGLKPIPRRTPAPEPAKIRIYYLMWRFPELSETFIQREIKGLLGAGFDVTVVADEISKTTHLGKYATSLLDITLAVYPKESNLVHAARKHFYTRRPLRTLNLFLYTIFHRYHHVNRFEFDLHVFNKALYIAYQIHKRGADRVHSPWADLNAFVALLVSRLLDIPYTVQARAHDIHRSKYIVGMREKFLNAEFTITNSEYNVTYLRSILPELKTNRLVRIYNSLPLNQLPTPKRSKRSDGTVQLVSVARLIEQKGLPTLLRSCASLRELGTKFHLTIVGGPEEDREQEASQVAEVTRELDLEDVTTFTGSCSFSNTMHILSGADIFVLACEIAQDGSRDITPNSLLEAMAMGLPVIATRITAIPEIVDHELNGLLVEAGNVSELADAIHRLVQDHDLRAKLGNNARKKIAEQFDPNINTQKYASLFKAPLVPARMRRVK